MKNFLASNFCSEHKIMDVEEKEKEEEEEAKAAKVEKAEKVVVVVAYSNHTIRQITVVAERATAERPNTLLANCATRMATISLIVRS